MSKTGSIKDLVERIRLGAEAAAKARLDPEIQAKAAAEYEGRIVDLPEIRRQHREREWRSRGIPERLWPMLHDGAPDEPVGPLAVKPTPAMAAVSAFLASNEKTFLVLSGHVDTGKTVAAAWAAAWSSGRFVKAMDLVRAGLYPDDRGFWPRMQAEKLLVIDDLGVEPMDAGGFGKSAIVDLIDVRYDGARRTIITTNLSPRDLGSRFGERMVRRIAEAGTLVSLTREAMRR